MSQLLNSEFGTPSQLGESSDREMLPDNGQPEEAIVLRENVTTPTRVTFRGEVDNQKRVLRRNKRVNWLSFSKFEFETRLYLFNIEDLYLLNASRIWHTTSIGSSE